jgi:hypothetical protein
VRASNPAGSSAYSNTASARTLGDRGASCPERPHRDRDLPEQINLSWTDNSSNETGFKVERATSSGGAWTQIGTTTGIASFPIP